MRTLMAALIAASMLVIAAPVAAHFQLVHTPEVNINRPGSLPFRLIFWHPLENGQAMNMGPPEEFFYVFRGERTDLKDLLQPITFQGARNDARAYAADVPIKRNGDYIFVVVPTPYYEESEDIYIQQIAKSFVNKGGIPSGWDEPVGLATEIVPLNKPTNVLAGSTFSGVVLSDGKPAPGAEVEVEYLAAMPDLATNSPGPVTASPMPGGAIVAITDANGVFTFGVPRAGVWGFAALDVGPNKQNDGKKLSQDAILWIQAEEFD